jgi:hypothetical protein
MCITAIGRPAIITAMATTGVRTTVVVRALLPEASATTSIRPPPATIIAPALARLLKAGRKDRQYDFAIARTATAIVLNVVMTRVAAAAPTGND